MNLDLTDEEAAALLGGLDGIIDRDRYFMSQRIRTQIRAKIRLGRCVKREASAKLLPG
jgi:hypothetical protein